MEKRRRNIKNRINFLIIIFIFVILIIVLLINNVKKSSQINEISKVATFNSSQNTNTKIENTTKVEEIQVNNNELSWELTLVNSCNKLSEDYYFMLSDIDEYRKFDERAIEKLNSMIENARNGEAGELWVQSAYRSIEDQEKIYNNKVQEYMRQGKTKIEAQKLTEQTINKPGCSEHNLGLAVDFNYVNVAFEETKAFRWLKENAENYGFILRYPKEKEDITKVKYEPWHWRYVGIDNAKKINELGLCLEEYINYISN